MKIDDFKSIMSSLQEEFAVFKVTNPPKWAHEVQKGDLIIVGGNWNGIHIRTRNHIQIMPSSLKFIKKILLIDSPVTYPVVKEFMEKYK